MMTESYGAIKHFVKPDPRAGSRLEILISFDRYSTTRTEGRHLTVSHSKKVQAGLNTGGGGATQVKHMRVISQIPAGRDQTHSSISFQKEIPTKI